MDIGIYSLQSAVLKHMTSTDKYGEKTFSSDVIKVRYEDCTKKLVNKDGNEVVSNARIFCKAKVVIDDEITYENTTYTAIQVKTCRGLNGKISYYECYLI